MLMHLPGSMQKSSSLALEHSVDMAVWMVLHIRFCEVIAGDEQPGMRPADVVFVIDQKPHAVFTRDGNDLLYTHRLPLAAALCGTQLTIQHLDGNPISIPISEVSSSFIPRGLYLFGSVMSRPYVSPPPSTFQQLISLSLSRVPICSTRCTPHVDRSVIPVIEHLKGWRLCPVLPQIAMW